MTIEVLFPEVCNLYGELANVRYLQQSCPALQVVETDLHTRPRFLDEEIALVYMGSATERGLELAAQALRPVKEEMEQRIAQGQLMLFTGNALDVLGQGVDSDNGWQLQGLGILPTRAQYHMMQRHNSFFLGKLGEMDIVGFKSLFGHTYGAPEEDALFLTVKGVGRNEQTALEGFRLHNLLATYLIGPLLVLNPPLTRYLLEQMGIQEPPAFEEAAMEAYRIRVAEFAQEKRSYLY